MSVGKLLTLVRKLEARRKELLADLRLPIEGLPGSLAQSRRCCGSAGCHCHQGEGHLSWALTFMVDRRKRVEHIPDELLDAVRGRLEEGNAYKSGVAELMAINAQILILKRRAQAGGSRRQEEGRPVRETATTAAAGGAAPPPKREMAALRQIKESSQALLREGKTEETWEFLVSALEAVLSRNCNLELLVAKLRRDASTRARSDSTRRSWPSCSKPSRARGVFPRRISTLR